MEAVTAVAITKDQRASERSSVNWPVSIWHPKASKFFNGRSVNVSSVGALVTMPMKVPVCEGQELEVNFPRTESLAKDKGRFARIKTARVVWVDRSDSLKSTNINVGLKFNYESGEELVMD